jgi:hypothetical protein
LLACRTCTGHVSASKQNNYLVTVNEHSNQLIIFHGLDHQPQSTRLGRVRPSPEWLGQVRPNLKKKNKKNS